MERGPASFLVLGLTLASLVLAAGFCELAARLMQPPRYFALWQFDPLLGHAPAPSAAIDIDWWISEGVPVTHYRTNRWGFRDREFQITRRPGVARVLVVGDSFAEAAEVEADERFSAELERRLSRPDRPVEVWNMGVGDYGTGQEYLLVRRYVDVVRPDVVVLQMFPLNDVVNNGRDFAENNESQADYLRPYFVLDSGGRLVRADRHPLRALLRRHSRLFAEVEFAWLSFAAESARARGASREADIRRRHRAAGELGILEHRILVDEVDRDDWSRAWRVTTALLREIRDRVADAGATLVVVLVPCREEYVPSALERLGRDVETATGEARRVSAELPSRRICGELAAMDVSCIAMRDMFAAVWGESGPRHERHGHYDPEGHRLIASSLAPAVESALTLRGGVRQPR
jgi:hypothetical protein